MRPGRSPVAPSPVSAWIVEFVNVSTDSLTDYLHGHIPLTRHMGIAVTECSEARVVLAAPIEPNVNHRDTAFGGSLSGAAILAGWTWIYALLKRQERSCRIVIHDSTTHFGRPVAGRFEAICEAPPPAEIRRFLDSLDRRGKGRLGLESHVQSDGVVAVRHTGRYVALADGPAEPVDVPH